MSDQSTLTKAHEAETEWIALDDAFSTVRAAIIAELIATSPTHELKIQKLHMAAQNLDAVRTAILQVIDHGKVARQALSLAGLTETH